MPDLFIGIDPGLKGAIAVDRTTKGMAAVYDMPVTTIFKAGKPTTDMDKGALAAMLFALSIEGDCSVVVEEQSLRPGQRGLAKALTNYGIILGLLIANKMPYRIVRPQVWKERMVGLKKSKGQSVKAARTLYPKLNSELLPSKDGRAEALLMAKYGQMVR